ncbi:regulator of protease activity HflC (stomatin/prohibitin superfamily) [Halopolyspora algeriensis]|uniref:Regulator of protease activity HflC (Stomatin/prohibitin superfamily) n=1 Tax=Halopolyspora algeriensis TaxID=1500506 RepID=A0A368VFX1_9ACTN|nr:SPFH domain-containing protein [Halopolyspora algeriensis]RCW40062.1 regulator of protease activity HflC (stomatin/prohibitin superfamily) [Halopolyspora algeriensis]TQM56789.1 regulator of protease activity HflC (stomatin/prohibitin superfamily) [Halopolyspora algeriensis]
MSIAAAGRRAQGLAEAVGEAAEEAADEFAIDPGDFISAREQGASAGTRIEQQTAPIGEIGEIVNRSVSERGDNGEWVNVICPVVIPKRSAFTTVVLPILALVVLAVAGVLVTASTGMGQAWFGPHIWVLLAIVAVLLWARRSVIMVPDGCQAMIAKFSKLDRTVGPGRTVLLDPRKQVSYVVNTTREYPYNAPISEAPTRGGIKASVDLFLQFRIEDPTQFMYALGAVSGFSDKLSNAVSEVTRSLIYQQRAEDIYDLVGESTQELLDSLNEQFLPAVRLTSANITHAEPSNQQYRADLAAPEMVRLAKEAYTYEHELSLRKEQDEGDLNKELASMNESLSGINAEIANYQAQMDTALERETNRAKAQARQRYVEAESTANANAALLEAQALDIRAVSAAETPEILEHRYEQDVLNKLEGLAEHLPMLVSFGDGEGNDIDYLATARRMLGISEDGAGLSDTDVATIRQRTEAIQERVRSREAEIDDLLTASAHDAAGDESPAEEIPGAERVEQIRASVTDESITEQVEHLGGPDSGSTTQGNEQHQAGEQ